MLHVTLPVLLHTDSGDRDNYYVMSCDAVQSGRGVLMFRKTLPLSPAFHSEDEGNKFHPKRT